MQTSKETHQVELNTPHTGTWYENLTPILVTVADSGDPTEFYITEGEHQGKHILKSDCRQAIQIEGMRLAG